MLKQKENQSFHVIKGKGFFCVSFTQITHLSKKYGFNVSLKDNIFCLFIIFIFLLESVWRIPQDGNQITVLNCHEDGLDLLYHSLFSLQLSSQEWIHNMSFPIHYRHCHCRIEMSTEMPRASRTTWQYCKSDCFDLFRAQLFLALVSPVLLPCN